MPIARVTVHGINPSNFEDAVLEALYRDKTAQRGRAIGLADILHEAGIAIDHHGVREAVLLERRRHCPPGGFGRDISASLCAQHQAAACINGIEDFGHLLLLPMRISWDG